MHRLSYKGIVARALTEDLAAGDLTTESIFRKEKNAEAAILAREGGVIAGLPVAAEVFHQVDNKIIFHEQLHDGDIINAGDILVTLEGPAASILMGERVSLNFLQRLSGIATATREAVDTIAATSTRITDTRKTTPNLRLLEKYAVRMGGGENHRFNLADMIMIKDNHIRAAGSITEAVTLARQARGFPVKIEVETTGLNEVKEALDCGVDIIMLDNMEIDEMAEAVSLINGRVLVEASGSITKERLLHVASTGVDIISLGYLTYGSGSLDFSLNFV